MGRASDAPAAGSAGTRAAPKTPASSLPSAGQSHNAAPLPAGSHPQSEPHNEPERKAPHPSSPSPCRFPTKAICCRIFTPALPDYPAASLRDFLSGASTFWDVRNRCFWILLQDKSNSVVAVRHNPTPALHLPNLNGGCIGVFFMTKAARQRAHELRSMPIHEISQLHVSIRFH